jgi:TRAP-type C4-dicarboxylate transport system permease small subunit
MSDQTIAANSENEPRSAQGRFDLLIEKVFYFFLAYMLLFLVVVVTWQVISRTLNIKNTWTEELSRWAFVWSSFMGTAYLIHKKDHIIVDLVKEMKTLYRFILFMEIPLRMLCLCFYVVVAYGGILLVRKYGGEMGSAVHVPVRVLYYSCPVSFLLIIFFELLNIVRLICAAIRKRRVI